jgi:hypothetical protein
MLQPPAPATAGGLQGGLAQRCSSCLTRPARQRAAAAAAAGGVVGFARTRPAVRPPRSASAPTATASARRAAMHQTTAAHAVRALAAGFPSLARLAVVHQAAHPCSTSRPSRYHSHRRCAGARAVRVLQPTAAAAAAPQAATSRHCMLCLRRELPAALWCAAATGSAGVGLLRGAATATPAAPRRPAHGSSSPRQRRPAA